MKKIRAFGKYLAIAALCLIIPLSSAAYWLFGSRAGAQWVLNTAKPYLPVTVQFSRMEGNLWQGLSFTDLDITPTDSHGSIPHIKASDAGFRWRPWTLMKRRLSITEFHVHGGDLVLATTDTEKSSEPLRLPEIKLPISIVVNRLTLRNNTLTMAGNAQPLPNITARGKWVGRQLALNKLVLDYQQNRVAGNLDIKFANPMAFSLHETHNGSTHFKGTCQQQENIQCDTDLQWRNFSHPITGPVSFPNGTFAIHLNKNNLQITGNTDFVSEPLETQLELDTDIDLQQQQLTLNTLNAELLSGTLASSGKLSWKEGLKVHAESSLNKVDISQWLEPVAQHSHITLKNTFELRQQGDTFNANTLTTIDAWALDEKTITGTLNALLENQTLRVNTLKLRSKHSSVTAKGYYHLNTQALATTLNVSTTNLGEWAPDSRGAITTEFTLAGALNKPQVSLQTSIQHLQLGKFGLDDFTLTTALRSKAKKASPQALIQGLQIEKFEAQAQNFTIENTVFSQATVSLAGSLAKHNLLVSASNLPGQFNLETLAFSAGLELPPAAENGSIKFADAAWRIHLQTLQFNHQNPIIPEPFTLENPTDILLSQAQSETGNLCVKKQRTRICINQLAYSTSGAFDFDALVDGIYLDRERIVFPDYYTRLPPGWDLEGEIVGTFSGSGTYTNNTLELRTNNRLEIEEAAIHYKDPDSPENNQDYPVKDFWVTVNGSEQALVLQGKTVLEGAQELAIDGLFKNITSKDPDMRVALFGHIQQFQPLQLLFPSASELQGSADIDIQLVKNAQIPEGAITGTLDVSDFGLFLPAYGTRVSQWNLQANATQHTLNVTGAGHIGDGNASIKGKLQNTPGEPLATDLSISGTQLTLVNQPDRRFNASPDITLTGKGLDWHLSGKITINDSFLHLENIPASAVNVSEDAKIYGVEETENTSPVQFSADIQIIAGEKIYFNGFGLSTDIAGRLYYTRQPEHGNHLQGILTLPEGKFAAYGQKLEIENGQIIFSGTPSNPTLDVRAARKIDAITAGIWLHGPANRLKSSLYSSPTMNDSDVLSYMLTGKPLSRATESEEGSMEGAALALGLRQALPTLQKIGDQIGISDISVESGPAGNGGALAAGKRLNDKIYVKYQYGLVGAVGRFVIEYHLTNRLKLEAGSGETDTLDITYTWDSEPPSVTEISPNETVKDNLKSE